MPRPPSSRLKRRIFAGEITAADRSDAGGQDTRAARAPRWASLAPALAVCMLFAVLTGSGPDGSASHRSLPSMRQLIGGVPTDEATLARLGSSMHSPHNNLQKATFEWTNESPSLTTSPPLSGTNSLFQ